MTNIMIIGKVGGHTIARALGVGWKNIAGENNVRLNPKSTTIPAARRERRRGEGFGHISPEFSPKFFTENSDPPKDKLMASLNRPKRKELGAVEKVTSTSSKKEMGGRGGGGGEVGG